MPTDRAQGRGLSRNSRDSCWWQSGGWGKCDQVAPCFSEGSEASRYSAGALVHAAAALVHAAAPGCSGAGRKAARGLAESTPPRQVQHHRVSPGDRRGRYGHLGRRDTERELGRTWCLPLHLWLALGNLLWLQQRQRLGERADNYLKTWSSKTNQCFFGCQF